MLPKLPRALLVLAAVGICVAARAQEPPAQAQEAAPQTPPAQQQPRTGQRPIFRTGAELVRVDVSVTTGRGEPVTDLAAEDFTIEEDGTPQQIAAFELIEADGEPEPDDEVSLPIRSREHARAEAARDDVRVFLIFWDDYHIDRMGSALRARAALERFVLEAFGPTDLVAIMDPMTALDAIEFTRDRRKLANTARQLEGRRGIYVPPRNAAEENQLQSLRNIERLRHEVTLSAIKSAATYLGVLRDSRKSLIVISESIRAEHRDVADVIQAANSSNTALFTIDPRGLDGGMSTWLQTLAEETGGQWYRRNDIRGALDEVVRRSTAYYLLGYVPTNPALDGKYRSIRVRLRKGGYEVKARAGYWAPSLEAMTRSAKAAAESARPAAVERAFAELRPTGSRRAVDLWFGTWFSGGRIEGRAVWTPRSGIGTGDDVTNVSLLAAQHDEPVFDGDILQGSSATFPLRPGPLTLTFTMTNAGGIVVDREVRNLSVADPDDAILGLTQPHVFRARNAPELRALLDAANPMPTAVRDFDGTDRLLLRFTVFGSQAARTVVRATLLNGRGREAAKIPARQAGAAGVYEIDLPLSNIAQGEWLLAIEAASGEDRARILVPFRVGRG